MSTNTAWIVSGSTSCLNQIGFGEPRGKAIIPVGCVYGDVNADDTKARAQLCAAAPALLSALEELLAAELTQMPPYEYSKAAQDAWADRRAAAENNARAAIALATQGKQS